MEPLLYIIVLGLFLTSFLLIVFTIITCLTLVMDRDCASIAVCGIVLMVTTVMLANDARNDYLIGIGLAHYEINSDNNKVFVYHTNLVANVEVSK